MPGLVPGIHDLLASSHQRKTWMAGTSPAMTSAAQMSEKFRALDEQVYVDAEEDEGE
jgi:hypothetical protein